MARVLSTATVLGLLAATAVAFAITEGAKLTRSPIGGTQVTKVFSPSSPLPAYRVAHIEFRMRTSERLTVWIEDSHGTNVRTLLRSRAERNGARLDLTWNGLAEDAVLSPDGVYRPVVKLERSHRIIGLPNPIRLDTVKPKIVVPNPVRAIISPDGDGHHDRFVTHYRADEYAHAILIVRSGARTQRVEFTRTQKPVGVLEWNGRIFGSPAKPGTYTLSVSAQDSAGNVAAPYVFAVVTVRYVSLGRSQVVVGHGKRFAIRVSADAPTVTWELHGRSGKAKPGTLTITAPKTPGTYTLYVTVGNHAARATVLVK